MTTCTRKIQFCAGHRVYGHESKCAHLHGHNYTVLLTARKIDSPLDPIGRVVDFSVLKEVVGGWIDSCLDHKMILFRGDPMLAVLSAQGETVVEMNDNPTAENLAATILKAGNCLLEPHGVRLVRVRVWETDNCYADVEAL